MFQKGENIYEGCLNEWIRRYLAIGAVEELEHKRKGRVVKVEEQDKI